MAFNLDDYEPVADRIERFWNDHPEGRIVTELVHYDDKHFIVKALIYRGSGWSSDGATLDVPYAATGFAEEIIGSTNVNRTSALENCETSAIGRALANLGYAVKGQRPSREEMVKAQPQSRQRSGPQQRTPRQSAPTATTTPVASPKQDQASKGTEPAKEAPDLELVRWVAKQKLWLVDQLGGDKNRAKDIWANVLATYDLEPDQLPLKDSLQFIQSDLSIALGRSEEIVGQEALLDPEAVAQ